MPDYDLELAVYRPDGHPISASAYLRGRESDPAGFVPSWNDSTLLLFLAGTECVAQDTNLGRVDWIVRQLEAVLERLRRGQDALLRSAVLDQWPVPYFLFEAGVQAQEARLSQFTIEDDEVGGLFPIPHLDRSGPERLYAYVGAQRAALRAGATMDRAPFPLGRLLAALEREVEVGRRLLQVVPVPDWAC